MPTIKSLLETEFTQEICHELLPEWQGLDVNISILSGGITNKLYRIQSEKGDCTVRVYGDKTDLFIDRENEYNEYDNNEHNVSFKHILLQMLF